MHFLPYVLSSDPRSLCTKSGRNNLLHSLTLDICSFTPEVCVRLCERPQYYCIFTQIFVYASAPISSAGYHPGRLCTKRRKPSILLRFSAFGSVYILPEVCVRKLFLLYNIVFLRAIILYPGTLCTFLSCPLCLFHPRSLCTFSSWHTYGI